MPKTYRKIQQWERWLEHFPGNQVLATEHSILPHMLCPYYGTQALLIGTPQQYDLLKASAISMRTLLSPLLNHKQMPHIRGIESDFYELPIATGSVDLVLMPHTLDFMDHPRHLLSEACRIVRPDGHIVICGFNPYSLMGLRKLFSRKKDIPWSGHFTAASQMHKWLKLADFELVEQKNFFYRWPVTNPAIFKKLRFLDWLGEKLHLPFGGIYILVAKAKVIPLTPIRMRWKQHIYGLGLPTIGMPKPTTRNVTNETCDDLY